METREVVIPYTLDFGQISYPYAMLLGLACHFVAAEADRYIQKKGRLWL